MEKLAQKESRIESILLSLKKLNYLSRSQLQTLHGLGSARNASRVLKEMSEYLSYFRDGENIYYLNKEGRERVNSKKVLKKSTQARHYLMRNSIFITFGCPSSWKNEVKLGFKEVKNSTVICDAIFSKDNRYHIVEVDHTQKMTKNRTKVERYKKLIELDFFKVQPLFIWVTTTEYRRKELIKLSEGLDAQVFTIHDFQ